MKSEVKKVIDIHVEGELGTILSYLHHFLKEGVGRCYPLLMILLLFAL